MHETSVTPALVAAAVVRRRNDLLVVRRTGRHGEGEWTIPTVAVRRGETLVEAAVRSVAECADLGGLAGPFIDWYESIDTAGDLTDSHEVVMCFDVLADGDGPPTAGDGFLEARWMPVWEVSELPLVDGLASLLADQGVIDTLT